MQNNYHTRYFISFHFYAGIGLCPLSEVYISLKEPPKCHQMLFTSVFIPLSRSFLSSGSPSNSSLRRTMSLFLSEGRSVRTGSTVTTSKMLLVRFSIWNNKISSTGKYAMWRCCENYNGRARG